MKDTEGYQVSVILYRDLPIYRFVRCINQCYTDEKLIQFMLPNQFDKLPQCASIHPRIQHSIPCMSQSLNGNLVACGYTDGIIGIYVHRQSKLLVLLKGHTEGIVDVRFSSDNQSLASCSWYSTIRVWKLNSRSHEPIFLNIGLIYTISYSPDGLLIALGGDATNVVVIWNIQIQGLFKIMKGHTKSIFKVEYSPNGKLLVSGSKDESIKLWNAQTGNQLMTFIGHINSIDNLQFAKDSQNIISISQDHTIRMWNIETGEQVKSFVNTKTPYSLFVIYTAVNQYIIAKIRSKYIEVWTINNGQSKIKKTYEFASHMFKLSSGGNYMITVDTHGVIRVHRYKLE